MLGLLVKDRAPIGQELTALVVRLAVELKQSKIESSFLTFHISMLLQNSADTLTLIVECILEQ
jgi:hypothetical protein